MQYGARPRRYIVHLPEGREHEDGLPVVLALHGAPGFARNLMENSGLNRKADSAGFIVVYPDGTSLTDPQFLNWNPGHCCGYAYIAKVDDVGFLTELARRIVKEYHAAENRVYAAGFSKGGMMAYRLACDAAHVFAGIADISGALNLDDCKPARPIDVFISHGFKDRNVPYGNGIPAVLKPVSETEDRPVAYAVEFWKRKNDCVTGGMRFRGKAEMQRYQCEKAGLMLVSIVDEGHSWPGGGPNLAGAELPTLDIFANDLMWDFWQEQYALRTAKSGNGTH